MTAIRELLTRTLGTPIEADLIERLERVEAILGEDAPSTCGLTSNGPSGL